MNTVYSVGFLDGKFLMVYNPKREGWEMPGGKIEPGETAEEAARREFIEESGYDVKVISTRKMWDSWGCVCQILGKVGEGEMEYAFFEDIPEELAFQKEEYEEILEWAFPIING